MCDATVKALLYIYPADHALYLAVKLQQQQFDEIAINRNKEYNCPIESEQRSF